MSGGESLGGLWYELEAKSGTFMTDMDAAEKRIEKTKEAAEKISKTIKDMGLAFAAVGGAIVGSMGLAVKSWAEGGDAVAKMSQRTGLGTTALQEYGYAAKLSGTSIEEIEVSVKKMQSSITDASNGVLGASKSFTTLHLSVEKLKKLAPEEQFKIVSEAVANVKDPTLKASLALDLFGRSGTMLLPMLKDGAAGLQSMREEAHIYGKVLDEESIKQSEELSDNIDRMKSLFTGLSNELVIAVLPMVEKFTEGIKSAGVQAKTWIDQNKVLFATLASLTLGIGGLSLGFGTVLLGISGVITAFIKIQGTITTLIPVIQSLWTVVAANPLVAVVAALAIATNALLDWMLKSQDAANANINMGKSVKDLIALHEKEKESTKQRIAIYESTMARMEKGSAGYLKLEQKVSDEKAILARTDKAIMTEKARFEQQTEAAKNAAIEGGLATHHATKLSLIDQYMAQKQYLLQNEINTEALMTQTAHENLASSFLEFSTAQEKSTVDYYTRLSELASGFQSTLASGFAEAFGHIGEGWDNLKGIAQKMMEGLRDVVLRVLADMLAQWIVKHAAMTLVTVLWGKKEIAVNAGVAASKAAATTAWTLWGSIAIGAAIGAAVMGFAGSFANGGFIPGNSFTGDNTMAAVNSGEAILNGGQQREFMDIANGKGGGNGGVGTVNLLLDGKVIARVTAEQLDRSLTHSRKINYI